MIDRLWYRFNLWRHGNLWHRIWYGGDLEWVEKRLVRRVTRVAIRLEDLEDKHGWWYGCG